jgi:hypothetical protein
VDATNMMDKLIDNKHIGRIRIDRLEVFYLQLIESIHVDQAIFLIFFSKMDQ